MNDKRQYDDSRTPFLRWFWELPPLVRVVLVVLVLLALLFALLPKSLFHSFNCQAQTFPENYGSSNGYFIDNQVIIVGRREDIEKVIATSTPVATNTPGTPVTPVVTITPETSVTPPTAITLLAVATPTVSGTPATLQPPVPTSTATTGERVVLNRIEGCDLSYLNYRKDRDSGAAVETGNRVMLLYEIPNTGKSVAETIADINGIAAKKGVSPKNISVDPNYLTRLSDSTSDPCALPGDPGSGGGRPFGGPGALSRNAYDASQAQVDFKNQWAFRPQGINLPNTSSLAFDGRGVRVGVFDTSPYRLNLPFIKRVGVAFPSPLWFTNWDAGGTTMMSNHGLFVAGLIHRIAPRSSIQLIRVLNEDGCGQLWVLNKGLEQYKSRMSAWTGKLDKTVINMSLGIRVPHADENNGTTPAANSGQNEDLTKLANEDLGTLQTLINEVDRMGAIVVAAAGNDSTIKITNGTRDVKVEPMQIPASFNNVIGVVATNPDGQRSCYSNEANGDDDLAAPGGEGGIDRQDRNNLCVSRAASWDDPDPTLSPCLDGNIAECKYGLISLAETRYGPRYMLWSGTSFATPLVSGLAALVYEQWDQKYVKCIMKAGARKSPAITPDDQLGAGIIDVKNTLSTTAIPPSCPPSP